MTTGENTSLRPHPGEHIAPWFNCKECRRTAGYTVSLEGMSVKPDDYLPSMNDVMAKRDEKAAEVGGKHGVTTIDSPGVK